MGKKPLSDRQKGQLSLQMRDAIEAVDVGRIEGLRLRGADPSFPIREPGYRGSRVTFTPAGFTIKSNESTLLPHVIGTGLSEIPLGLINDGVHRNIIEMLSDLRNPPPGMIAGAVRHILGCMSPDAPDIKTALWQGARGFLTPRTGQTPDLSRAVYALTLLKNGAAPPDTARDVPELFSLPVAQSSLQPRPPRPFVYHFFEIDESPGMLNSLFAAGYSPDETVCGVPLVHYAATSESIEVMQTLLFAGARLDIRCDKAALLAAGFPEKSCTLLAEQASALDLAIASGSHEMAMALQSALAKRAVDSAISAGKNRHLDA